MFRGLEEGEREGLIIHEMVCCLFDWQLAENVLLWHNELIV